MRDPKWVYRVRRARAAISPGAGWDSAAWQPIPSLTRDEDVVDVPVQDARRLEVARTLPTRLEAEITAPGPGVAWRANFYKCADSSSHPPWLTWAPVDWPRPDFHWKEFFGTLEFGE